MGKIIAVSMVLGLVAFGCGDDSGGGSSLSGGDQELADAIADQILAEDSGAISEDEAQCVGNGTVSELGTSRLADLGLTLDAVSSGTGPDDVDLPEGDIGAIVDVYLDCVDVQAAFTEGMLGEGGVSNESAECIADSIDEDVIRQSVIAGISGEEFNPEDDPELIQNLLSVMTDCLSPEELSALTG